MITAPIIEEIHAIREQIYNESKEKGMSVLDYIKQDAPMEFNTLSEKRKPLARPI